MKPLFVEGQQFARSGVLFIVSGPSGAGKTSMSGAALDSFPELELSRSVTTRSPRGGECDGDQYNFISRNEFIALRDCDGLAEWAEVHSNFYGTPREPIERAMEQGRDLLLDIDVQGASQIKALYGDAAVAIFLLPPDRKTLENRLRGRATDDAETVALRLRAACREIASLGAYDYVIVNNDLEDAKSEFRAVLRAERRRVARLRSPELAKLIAVFQEDL
ncbi:MAG: guanylate kinase [Hyphomicrobiaceae bacterium]|jgi:guanylate kinase